MSSKKEPYYGLKITKPGIGYLIFRCHNTIDNAKIDRYQSCKIYANKGKVVTSKNPGYIFASGGPSIWN